MPDEPSARRIERAKELLRVGDLTITEICFAVGFSSLGSFGASFKESVGLSPLEYRERALSEDGPVSLPRGTVLMWTGPDEYLPFVPDGAKPPS